MPRCSSTSWAATAPICLFCVEREPLACHRSLVAVNRLAEAGARGSGTFGPSAAGPSTSAPSASRQIRSSWPAASIPRSSMAAMPSQDWNIARVHGVVELAASIATTWDRSPLRIWRMRVAGTGGACRPRRTAGRSAAGRGAG